MNESKTPKQRNFKQNLFGNFYSTLNFLGDLRLTSYESIFLKLAEDDYAWFNL